ncbi:unnamed protein product [Caenorhabditis sp. 36 PRJEB53466]|nr:unnamed protein product [Caenorhabditis sp. 36 PRJEB53466]
MRLFAQYLIAGHNPNQIPIPLNNQPFGFPITTRDARQPYVYSTLPSCDELTVDPQLNLTMEWRKMKECQFSLLQRFFGNPESVLPNFVSVLYVCDDVSEVSRIIIKEFLTARRPYYAALPKCRAETVLLNLGIEEDDSVAQKMKEAVENLKLYGTSPNGRTSNIYDKVFPIAIAQNDSDVSVITENGEIGRESMKATGLEKFLKTELNNMKFIDILWINFENGPFEYWKFVNPDELFDKLGLTLCQIGVEMRSDQHQNFYAFMLSVLNKRRYIFLKPTTNSDESVVRVILVNIVNKECYRKYVL